MPLRIYGDSISGNCLKVKWTADHLGLPFEWVETSVLQAETRTPDFLPADFKAETTPAAMSSVAA